MNVNRYFIISHYRLTESAHYVDNCFFHAKVQINKIFQFKQRKVYIMNSEQKFNQKNKIAIF